MEKPVAEKIEQSFLRINNLITVLRNPGNDIFTEQNRARTAIKSEFLIIEESLNQMQDILEQSRDPTDTERIQSNLSKYKEDHKKYKNRLKLT
jgi:hypothetical protein